jgi:RimJ/RimL family protein N-acetyltransferase
MKYIIQTERLNLREFTFDDTAFIIELVNSPGWLKFIGNRNIKTESDARVYLENGPMKSYIENGFGLSMVERKEDGKKIGMCGIIKRDTLENPDIGFAFLPEYSGQGYAFEIADATMNYAKEKLGIEKISAITVAGNERSVKLLEKIGMKFEKVILFGDKSEELLLYNR